MITLLKFCRICMCTFAMLGAVWPLSSIAMPSESLFFTPNEVMSIMRANQGFISQDGMGGDAGTPAVQDSRRIITLAGIAYRGANDWTVWLNGERVTPKNIPEGILGLTVKKDVILLKWLDAPNQRIVNLTLRPHQKYNLDTDTISSGT